MTREEASQLLKSLEAIRAYARGEAIQVRYEGAPWEDYDGTCPNFYNDNWEWRAKPEPREFIIQKRRDAITTSDVYLRTVGQSSGHTRDLPDPEYETIRVREVI